MAKHQIREESSTYFNVIRPVQLRNSDLQIQTFWYATEAGPLSNLGELEGEG